MSTLRCSQDETFSAYFTVMLFDSIGYELYAQDLQETNGSMGLGIYCTLDLDRAHAVGKEILVAEFRPTKADSERSGASDLLVVSEGDRETVGDRWRKRGFSGILFEGTELCVRVDCIAALYRRDWQKPQACWPGLARIVASMREPPFVIDDQTVETDAAWAKALERIKAHGDKQVAETRGRLESIWQQNSEQGGSGSCAIS
mmetsp:Transcript_76312/g.150904  ORF Transcript_76312/g.150904 Transcript_76312/m.150904 type:complete len:202 (+) Transcript_76312:130-735(+)